MPTQALAVGRERTPEAARSAGSRSSRSPARADGAEQTISALDSAQADQLNRNPYSAIQVLQGLNGSSGMVTERACAGWAADGAVVAPICSDGTHPMQAPRQDWPFGLLPFCGWHLGSACL